jgi:hypothetical protein
MTADAIEFEGLRALVVAWIEAAPGEPAKAAWADIIVAGLPAKLMPLLALAARAEKAEAEVARLVGLEWRETDDDARDGERMNLCWKAFGGIAAHVELGRWSAAKMAWVNTYGRPFSGAPDYYQRLPEPPAPRPDPAQPGQSSAQPAAERVDRFAADDHDIEAETDRAAPPAAGSAAGMGDGS